MGTRYIVRPEELTPDSFAPYGRAILPPDYPATKRSGEWDCWVQLENLGPGAAGVGIVITRPSDGWVTSMEAHDRREFLLPISGPVIQAVALPASFGQPAAQPDAASVRAFIIRPGQSIVMEAGTWHWAAIPWENEVLYYFLVDINTRSPGTDDNPWIPFLDGNSVLIQK
jgi:ureidoglycolate lyase